MLTTISMSIARSPSSPPESDEERILRVANDACKKLKLSRRINLKKIMWSKGVYSDECDLTAGFRRTGLLLPEELRGKLNTEEWRPIIFANLIRFKDGPRFLRILSRVLVFLVVIAGVGFLSNVLLGPSWGLLVLPATIFLLFLMLRNISRWFKRESLKLDDRIASIVGREVLLGVLSKIQSMHLPDIERLNRRRGFNARVMMSAKPSLTERIQFLEAHPRDFGASQ